MKTKEELNALKNEVENLNKKLAELTVDELAEVSGGGIIDDFLQWISSDMGYKSGVTAKYSPEQEVTFFYLDSWRNGKIVSIDSRDAGIINTEYTYTVQQIGSSTPIPGIYESNIHAR